MVQDKTTTQIAIDVLGKAEVASILGVGKSYITQIYHSLKTFTTSTDIDAIMKVVYASGPSVYTAITREGLEKDLARLLRDRAAAAEERARARRA